MPCLELDDDDNVRDGDIVSRRHAIFPEANPHDGGIGCKTEAAEDIQEEKRAFHAVAAAVASVGDKFGEESLRIKIYGLLLRIMERQVFVRNSGDLVSVQYCEEGEITRHVVAMIALGQLDVIEVFCELGPVKDWRVFVHRHCCPCSGRRGVVWEFRGSLSDNGDQGSPFVSFVCVCFAPLSVWRHLM